MAVRNAVEGLAALTALLPATGEVAYEVVHSQLTSGDNRAAVRWIHQYRRSGDIDARTDETTGKLMLARPGQGVKNASE